MNKPTIVLEFDGVINDMLHGWKGVDTIDGEPVKGVKESLDELSEEYRVVVHSFRCKEKRGKKAVKEWLDDNNIPYDDVVLNLPPHLAYISQKSIKFERNWEDELTEKLKRMNPSLE